MATEHLDRTDLRILELLQSDGRMSHVDVAASCGVVEKYAALVDPKRVGQRVLAFVQIKLERHTDEVIGQFRRMLAERPEVISAHAMTGEMDFLLRVVVPDLDALGRLTLHQLLKFPGVRDVRSSLVLETLKADAAIPLTAAPVQAGHGPRLHLR
jgi:Lrp/AsnC family leucine-responsive transcriptional regulator